MDIKLTVDGNLDLGDNFTIKLTTKEEDLVAQRINTTLHTNRGMWEYDTDFGVPWLSNPNNKLAILGKVPIEVYDGEIKSAIVNRKGVQKITYYKNEFNRASRESKVLVKVQTDSGSILTVDTLP